MKRYAIIAAAGILAAACGSKTPTTPTPTAPPNTIVFTAALAFANEIPTIPTSNADANARGNATVTFNLTRDAAGTITAATVGFVYSVSGFPAGTILRGTHVHEGGPAVAGGVKIDSGLGAANPIILGDGTMNNITFATTTFPDGLPLINQIIANPNGYYFNVHSGVNTGGAIRGQLVKQ